METGDMPTEQEASSVSPTETEDNSPAQEQTGSQDVSESTDTSAVEPSTIEDLLGVVEDALKPQEDSSASEQSEEDGEQAEAESGEGGEDAPLSEDEQAEADSKLPFHKHPRFKQVIEERKQFKAEADELRSDAEQYRLISGFMGKFNLSHQDVADTLQVAALMRTAPERAKEQLQAYIDSIDAYLGTGRFDDDLAEAVDNGEITEERAQELQQARAKARNLEEESQARKAEESRKSEEQQQAEYRRDIVTAVSSWERQTAKGDPDFKTLSPYVKDRLSRLVSAEEKAPSPERIVTLARQAYAAVKKELGTISRKPAGNTPLKGGSANGTGGNENPAPKTMLDVVERTLAA